MTLWGNDMKRVRKTKEETSQEIWDVIHRIERDNLELTIKNVCDLALVSRTTIYKYPDIKNYITEKDQTDIITKLTAENTKLHDDISNLKEYITLLEDERNKALINQFKNGQVRKINE
jgi:L-cysteine desulfidase